MSSIRSVLLLLHHRSSSFYTIGPPPSTPSVLLLLHHRSSSFYTIGPPPSTPSVLLLLHHRSSSFYTIGPPPSTPSVLTTETPKASPWGDRQTYRFAPISSHQNNANLTRSHASQTYVRKRIRRPTAGGSNARVPAPCF